MTSEYLPNSDTYLALEKGEIVGFVSMIENFLAAIFVDNKIQGKGIGKSLLDFVKSQKSTIQLKVYQKNTKAISFYRSQGFAIKSINNEKETTEKELLMEWAK
jgi:putative acetyltransferase